MAIRVFIADDHDTIREGIRSLLENKPGFIIVGEARDGEEVLNRAAQVLPNVVLMDMNMPIMSGLQCTLLLKKNFPSVKVILLSAPDYESYLADMLNTGANGYLLKAASQDELLFAIKKVAAGGRYIATEFTLALMAKQKASEELKENKSKTHAELSDREMDVLVLIAQGLTNSEIARKLFTSVRTIETRRKKLLEKTGTNNTATLMRFAVLNGIIN